MLRDLSFKHKRIMKGNVINDMQGVTFSQLGGETMKVVKKIIALDSDNYPDSLHKLYIINAPGIFNFIWKMVRPILHPVILAKIEICKMDRIPGALKEAGVADICMSLKYGGKVRGGRGAMRVEEKRVAQGGGVG
jgi:hypothetical protein